MTEHGPSSALPIGDATRAALRQYGPALHRYLRARLGKPEDVRDLAQEVFTRFWQISQQETIHHPQAFLYRLASNFVYEFRLREKRGVVACDSELLETATDIQADVWRNEPQERAICADQIARTLRSMPKLWQAILLMTKREGLSAEEIARKLNISRKTVYIYLGYALAQFRKERPS